MFRTAVWIVLTTAVPSWAAAPVNDAKKTVEISCDAHRGSAAVRNRANLYTVKLARHEPNMQYFIVADIQGTPSAGRPPERQGCNGIIWIKGTMTKASEP